MPAQLQPRRTTRPTSLFLSAAQFEPVVRGPLPRCGEFQLTVAPPQQRLYFFPELQGQSSFLRRDPVREPEVAGQQHHVMGQGQVHGVLHEHRCNVLVFMAVSISCARHLLPCD